jgi:hypothetical protein
MKLSEIKELLISSLDADADTGKISHVLEEEGISYDFKKGFSDKVLDRIIASSLHSKREVEFVRSMNYAFYRIALTGAAAIILLLISIFIMEGSLSLNSFLGVSDNFDESIVCLLTGN